jgi:short-subunit dehydrogenase
MSFKGQTIWIVGASSGIGRELAVKLAGKGATLILSARRQKELEQLQNELGVKHKVYPLDVADQKQVSQLCSEVATFGKLDRVICMSSVYEPGSVASMDLDSMSGVVDVNLKGPIYLASGVLPIFEKQKAGQIVFCGSVAGYTGLPDGQPYSSTKAAIANFAESLKAEVSSYIDVKLISPGFVKTPMTDKNDFTMPMIISSEEAASLIIKGLDKSAFEIHFPKRFTLIMKFLSIMPYCLKLFVTKLIRRAR